MSDSIAPSLARLSRRAFVAGLPLTLAACASSGTSSLRPSFIEPRRDPFYLQMYAAMPEERFPLPAIDLNQIEPQWLRREVGYRGAEPAGTIVVVPAERHLYLVREGGTAIRYGIGVGREGFAWSGRATIRRKAPWPTWTPPAEMVARDPKAAPWANGMPPGLDNPLGARALYLYQGNVDTLYRIHGTNEPLSIGKNVSSGCIRMLNQDIIDLFNRVPVGTDVLVVETQTPLEQIAALL